MVATNSTVDGRSSHVNRVKHRVVTNSGKRLMGSFFGCLLSGRMDSLLNVEAMVSLKSLYRFILVYTFKFFLKR
jgi:hypothetical protein